MAPLWNRDRYCPHAAQSVTMAGHMSSRRHWLRNAGLGSLLASFKSLFNLVGSVSSGDQGQLSSNLGVALTLAAAGAVAGLVFTALQPLRERSEFGRYVGWILTMYVVLASIMLVALSIGDEMAGSMITNPFGIALLLIGGALSGIIAARVVED